MLPSTEEQADEKEKSLAKVQDNEIIGTNFGAKLVDAVHGGQLH